MTQSTTEQPLITVFSDSEVRSYDSYTDPESLKSDLGPYDTLLVRREDRTVVAASASAPREALFDAYARTHAEEVPTDFYFFPGPRPLSQVASLSREKQLQPNATQLNR